MITLETLKPPPVEPAQAPMIIRRTSVCLENSGQTSKSTVAKPEVVMILETWKKAFLIVVPIPVSLSKVFTVIATVAKSTMPK